MFNRGKTQSETARLVMDLGCDCGEGNVLQYIHTIVIQHKIEVNKYVSSSHGRVQSKKTDYITRKGIFQYLWLHGELTSEHYFYGINIAFCRKSKNAFVSFVKYFERKNAVTISVY